MFVPCFRFNIDIIYSSVPGIKNRHGTCLVKSMWYNPWFVRLVFIFLGSFLASVMARAQNWQDMAAFPVHEAATYFINENYGFVFTPGDQGPSTDLATDNISLWRTTDGGNTWQAMNLGMSGPSNIWQLYFVSDSHGYMAVDASPGGSGSRGLFETLDSGSHWNRMGTQNVNFALQSFISVYAVDSLLFAISTPYNKLPVTLWMSSNAGITWQAVSSVVRPEVVTGN